MMFSLPTLVLLSMFLGYGGVAHDAGLSLWQTAFSVVTIWALPSNLILVAGIASGASLFAIALAVALAALRMMPMTIALVPEIRSPNTRRWHLYLVSCLVAVTAWVHTLQVARELPVRGRLPYFVGFGLALMLCATAVSMITWSISSQLSPIAMAALYFLTPLYFAISIWRAARLWAEHLALVFGFVLGPLLALVAPGGNILIAGVLGGVGAYGAHRIWRNREATQ
ncbi:AzlC family ABC transporter permease [Pseudahrensia aquimaris]|uniref:AzlC family ABC transporter permease n=1 Tax=Pseudahrensia aquimaris TaxID=744461 RepID=A0ABW3FHT9_9HYPH